MARACLSRPGEPLDALLSRVRPLFFDKSVHRTVTSKTPGEGQDILTASVNNLYDGVTAADLEGFEEAYPLNSRLVKRTAPSMEEVYRVGGRYAPYIERVCAHLQAATAVRHTRHEPRARGTRALLPHRQHG